MQSQTFYQQFPSFYRAVQASPHFQSQLIQLAAGELGEQCDAFFAEDFAVYRMRYHQPCLIMGQLVLQGFVGLGMVRSSKRCFFNGKAMQADDCLVLYPEGDNDLVLHDNGVLYVFALSHRFLAKSGQSLPGSSILDVAGRQDVIRLTHTEYLWQALTQVFDMPSQKNVWLASEPLCNLAEHLVRCVAKRKLLHYRRNSRGNLLSRAVRFILQHIECVEGGACVATRLHTSTRSLEKVFRQYLNLSPKEFINVAKINHFRQSIIHKSTNDTVTLGDLTQQLGVRDYAAFSKLFKAFYGQSPSKVKQEYASKLARD